jgi:hypothetical protein
MLQGSDRIRCSIKACKKFTAGSGSDSVERRSSASKKLHHRVREANSRNGKTPVDESQYLTLNCNECMSVASLEITFWCRWEDIRISKTLLILLGKLNIAQPVDTHLIKFSRRKSADVLELAVAEAGIPYLSRANVRASSVVDAVAVSSMDLIFKNISKPDQFMPITGRTDLLISFLLRLAVIIRFSFFLALVFVLVLGIVFRFSFLLLLTLLLLVLLYHFLNLTLLGFFFLLRGNCLSIDDGRSEALVIEMSGTDVEKVLRNCHLHGQPHKVVIG